MNLKVIISLAILYFISIINGDCQIFFKDIEFSFGYARQRQDRRLFEFPGRKDVIYYETSRYDYQYDFILNKNIFNSRFLTISGGAGYSLFFSKFSRPFDNCYFTGTPCSYVLYYIERYSIHNLKISNGFLFNLINNSKDAISIVFPIDLNFAFNKNIKSEGNFL